MQFRIEDDFWALFPEARIGVVVARGVDNTSGDSQAATLQAAIEQAAAKLADVEDMGAHPAVAPWREAYRAFGVKPNKYRSSIENLLRSARSGGLRSINPLVDLYNAVSLHHMLPCGGEDLAAINGPIRLTRAKGDEHFVPLGSSDEAPPQPGEIIYRDDVGVICRAWNWREADRTKLTENTRDAFLCIEAVPPLNEEQLSSACAELAQLVSGKLGASCHIELLSRERPEIEF